MGRVGAAGMGVTASPGETKAWADDAPTEDGAASDALGRRNGSVNRAYDYLSFAMDAYQQGQTPRLLEGDSDSPGLGSAAFGYDNPLTILAYRAARRVEDLCRTVLLEARFL